MAQSHNCAGLGDGDRCHMLDYCQYKLVAANAPGSGEYFCGKDQLTGHCRQNPPKMYLDKEAEIARLKGIVRRLDSLNTALCCTQGKLGDRIAQQDQELKDLGEALRKARETVLNEVSGVLEKKYFFYDCESESAEFEDAALKVIDAIRYDLGLSNSQNPLQKEPGLFICPKSEGCEYESCHHKKPHEHTGSDCEFSGNNCKSCIPYKKEPAKAKEHDDVCDSLQYVWVKHDLKKDGGVDYPGMAKDIGDLTLRLDLVDSRQAHDFRMITHLNEVLSIVGEFGSDRLYKIEERIGALEKKVK